MKKVIYLAQIELNVETADATAINHEQVAKMIKNAILDFVQVGNITANVDMFYKDTKMNV